MKTTLNITLIVTALFLGIASAQEYTDGTREVGPHKS
jgi:hypothetical protein